MRVECADNRSIAQDQGGRGQCVCSGLGGTGAVCVLRTGGDVGSVCAQDQGGWG